jgi:hypothetical protein
MGELGAGDDPELSEHFVQVVLHGAWADEQWRGDISVGYAPNCQGGDLRPLGGELLRSSRLPLLDMLAGGPQLQTRPLGEAVHTHAVEHVVGRAQLVAPVAAARS